MIEESITDAMHIWYWENLSNSKLPPIMHIVKEHFTGMGMTLSSLVILIPTIHTERALCHSYLAQDHMWSFAGQWYGKKGYIFALSGISFICTIA